MNRLLYEESQMYGFLEKVWFQAEMGGAFAAETYANQKKGED